MPHLILRHPLYYLQKLLPHFFIRYHTLVLFPKPPVPVPRYPVVHCIPDKRRHYQKHPQQVPGETQAAGYSQYGVAPGVGFVAFNQHKRIRFPFIQAVCGEQLLSGGRLQRGEPEPVMTVAAQHKIHTCIAELANAVEQYDGRFFHN